MDYRNIVPRKPPEGLIGWAQNREMLPTGAMLYKKVWVQDYGIEAVLEEEPRKIPAVEAVCSCCGMKMTFAYAHGGSHWNGKYGFFVHEGKQGTVMAGDGDEWECPCCREPVLVTCASTVRSEMVSDSAFVVSADLAPGEQGRRPLILTEWLVERVVRKNGGETFRAKPSEAYVFDGANAYKLTGKVRSYSGSVGYFWGYRNHWEQPSRWSESLGGCKAIYGLTRELVEESSLPNCKLYEYMDHNGEGYPVVYLRAFQRYPQVENLVVQRMTLLLNEMLWEEVGSQSWAESNYYGVPELKHLNLKEARPAQMLGLTKEELARVKQRGWSLYLVHLFVAAKEAGDRLSDEDIELAFRWGDETVMELVGVAPIGKCLRYLWKQMEQHGELFWMENDMTDEERELAEYAYDDMRLISGEYLRDYWDMAKGAGFDLTDPAVKWPRDLEAAHDGASAAYQAIEDEKVAKAFEPRYQQLMKYSFDWEGLMIVPARNQADLTREGKLLKHCVSRYGKDHALGRTAIFFIRHQEDPEKPFFTLELDEEHLSVRQNRGMSNCARTKEVQKFETVWMNWLKRGSPRNKDGTPKLPKKKKEVHAA